MRLVVLALVVLASSAVHAEETAATLAALPDKAAETRYLTELCARVDRIERDYVATMDAVQMIARGTSPDKGALLRKGATMQEGSRLAREQLMDEYAAAASAYRAKRKAAPPACAAMSADADARVAAKEDATRTAVRTLR